MTANRTSGSQQFFAEQTTRLKQQLDESVQQLQDAKNESGLVSIPVQQQALQSQLVQVETGSLTAASALASSEAAIDTLNQSLAKLPEDAQRPGSADHGA